MSKPFWTNLDRVVVEGIYCMVNLEDRKKHFWEIKTAFFSGSMTWTMMGIFQMASYSRYEHSGFDWRRGLKEKDAVGIYSQN